MFGGGVWRGVGAGRVSRDGAIVDDAPTARMLCLHELDGFLGAEECAGEVDCDHLHPLFVEEVLQRYGGGVGARVVEENIEAPEGLLGFGEQRPDGIRIGDVGGDREHLAAGHNGRRGGPLEWFGAPAGKNHRISRGLKRQGDGASYTAAGAGYERDLTVRHSLTLVQYHQFVIQQLRENDFRVAAVDADFEVHGVAHGARGVEGAKELDADFAHRYRREVSGLRVAGEIDEVE